MALFNDPSQKDFRRTLRRNATYAEKSLWVALRKNGAGVKFRRQESIGKFVVDFYAPELRLAVEVDGSTHDERQDYDRIRDDILASYRVTTLRFTDDQVLGLPSQVLEEIRATVDRMRSAGQSVRNPSTQLSDDEKLLQTKGILPSRLTTP